MSLPIYATGTVAVAAGGTIVTLAGGIWSGTNAKQGDFISIANSTAVLVTEVTDATHLKIAPWPGAAQTAAAYQIFQNYVGRVVGVAAAEDVSVMLEKLHVDGLPFIVGPDETVPDPSYGDEGQLAFKPDSGEWWQKAGGVWVPSAGLSGIPEAPNDGVQYGRQSLAWTPVAPPPTLFLNPKDYGAVGDGVTDDTAAIQACFNDATSIVLLGLPSGLKVVFPHGCYAVSSLDLNASALQIEGSGYVALMACKQTTAAPVLDATGCNALIIRDFAVIANNMDGTAPAVRPTFGLLLAQVAVGSGTSNVNKFDNFSTIGYYQYAATYINGATNSQWDFCKFGNLFPDGYACAISMSNILGAAGVSAGPFVVAELMFDTCEFHSRHLDATGNRPTIVIDGANDISFDLCLFDQSSGTWPTIQFYGNPSNNITFNGGKAYKEFGAGGYTYFLDASGTPANHVRVNNLQLNPPPISGNVTGTFTDLQFNPPTVPTRKIYTSGSGTYTRPTPPPYYLRVRLAGGGGGGGGSGTPGTAGNGGNGTDTVFGPLTAAHGAGANTNGQLAGSGGAAPAPAGNVWGLSGGNGVTSGSSIAGLIVLGGPGGLNPFFGGTAINGASTPNTGSGGCGGYLNGAGQPGGGGGGGAAIEAFIVSPAATYAWTVGAGGSAGTPGTGGTVGFAGATGIIVVEEFYQ
jgi:hypothetical protein